jgi:hypothetical protein
MKLMSMGVWGFLNGAISKVSWVKLAIVPLSLILTDYLSLERIVTLAEAGETLTVRFCKKAAD